MFTYRNGVPLRNLTFKSTAAFISAHKDRLEDMKRIVESRIAQLE